MTTQPNLETFATEVNDKIVAFIDILGFKNLITESPELQGFTDKYRSIFQPMVSEIQSLGIHHSLFSDSLFLTIESRRKQDELRNMIIFSKRLLQRSITNELPIRGAISKGGIIWDETVVAGTPIIEAVNYEKLQNWIGIILTPSALKYLLNDEDLLKSLINDDLIIKYDEIPTQSGERISGYAINFKSDNESENKMITDCLEKMKVYSGAVLANRKYKETEDFFTFLSGNG